MKTAILFGCLTTLALACAPTAAADINIGGLNLRIGDGEAVATRGNIAAAFNGGTATARGDGFNVAIANDGEALIDNTEGGINVAIANHGGARIQGGNWNLAVGQRGIASSVNSNFSVAVAGPDSTAAVNNSTGAIAFARGTRPGIPAGQGGGSQARADANLSVAVAFCGGTSISAQGDRINFDASRCFGG